MADLKIASTQLSDMNNTVADVTVDGRNTDGPSGLAETEWTNSRWPVWLGIYKEIPEVKIAIDTRAVWTLGKGYTTADPATQVVLDHVSGWGRDTFNSILKNMIITRRIGGDAFAEIIRDPDTGTLLNLKPLDPGTIKIVVDEAGRIKRYEQMAKAKGAPNIKFKPNEIFHLTNKRVADEIHGVSDIEAIEQIVLANKEVFVDTKKTMHYNVKPRIVFKLDTDDPTKIQEFIAKMDRTVDKGENIYIPKDTVEFEILSVAPNQTLNPLPWRQDLRTYFFQVVGIPQIILGSSGEFTESTAKIAYLAFEQSVEDEQLDIEEQCWNQLQYRINLEFPASLRNELLSDTGKDGAAQNTGFQPSDTTAGAGR